MRGGGIRAGVVFDQPAASHLPRFPRRRSSAPWDNLARLPPETLLRGERVQDPDAARRRTSTGAVARTREPEIAGIRGRTQGRADILRTSGGLPIRASRWRSGFMRWI